MWSTLEENTSCQETVWIKKTDQGPRDWNSQLRNITAKMKSSLKPINHTLKTFFCLFFFGFQVLACIIFTVHWHLHKRFLWCFACYKSGTQIFVVTSRPAAVVQLSVMWQPTCTNFAYVMELQSDTVLKVYSCVKVCMEKLICSSYWTLLMTLSSFLQPLYLLSTICLILLFVPHSWTLEVP